MKKLTAIEVKQLGLNYKGFFQNTELFKNIKELKLGEGLEITYKEWPLKATCLKYYIESTFEKIGMKNKFSVKSMQYGKLFVIIRIK